MNKFIKFTSLENTYKKKEISRVINEMKDDGDWVVLEKLDGANFAVYYSLDDGFRYASRNQFVEDDFFGCGEVIKPHHVAILLLHGKLIDNAEDTLIVRGELFGKGIQNRVYYGEDKYFNVFAIDVLRVDKGETTIEHLPYSDVVELFVEIHSDLNRLGLPLLELVPAFGLKYTFEDAIAVNEEFRSLLTPEGYEGDNTSEGVVIFPNEPKFFNSGSRIIFKKKSAKFSEVVEKKIKAVIELTDIEQDHLDLALGYINESRVLSAVSKIGDIDKTMFGVLMKEVMTDVYNDFKEENEISIGEIEADAKVIKYIKSCIQAEVANEVRKVFKTII